MPISRFDLERPLSDHEGKNSNFVFMQFHFIVQRNISVHFHHPPIKTVGQVPKMVKNRPKNGNDLGDLDSPEMIP